MRDISNFGDCSPLDSLEEHTSQLQRQADGFVAIAVIGWIGTIHMIIWLTVAYRIKWFHYHQFFLIVNQAVVDLLGSILWAFGATRLLIYSPYNCNLLYEIYDRHMETLMCTLIHLPANILFTCSQRSALIVAIDRLYSLLFPLRWIKSSQGYRFILITLAWLWSIGQEFSWFIAAAVSFSTQECRARPGIDVPFSADHTPPCPSPYSVNGTIPDHFGIICCFATELQCFRHSSIIPYYAFNTLIIITDVSDGLCFLATVLFYMVIPCFASGFCRRVTCGNPHVQVYWTGLEEQQRKIIVRVRLVSLVTVFSYFATSGIGIISGMWTHVNFGMNLWMSISIAGALGNSILALYLFAWKDPAFGMELLNLFSRKAVDGQAVGATTHTVAVTSHYQTEAATSKTEERSRAAEEDDKDMSISDSSLDKMKIDSESCAHTVPSQVESGTQITL